MWSTWKKQSSKLILGLVMTGFTIVISADDFPGYREGENAYYVGQTELPTW